MSGIVIASNDDLIVAKSVAMHLNYEFQTIEHRRFPDREAYIRFPENIISQFENPDIILVANTYPDEAIIQTLLTLETIQKITSSKKLKGGKKTLAIPYYGYARQDKQFLEGESISASTLANLYAQSCDHLVLLDVHAKDPFKETNAIISHATIIPEISEYFNSGIEIDLILSPDAGSKKRAEELGNLLNVPVSYLTKKRIDAHTIIHEPKELGVLEKKVLIVDDMISTGGTIVRAAESLRQQGAREIHAACTHGLFTSGAAEKLMTNLDSVIASTSLPSPVSTLDAGRAIARTIKKRNMNN